MPEPHQLQVDDGRMVLTLDRPWRCIASTIVGGGIGQVQSWLNLQVPLDYARLDPVDHLLGETADLPGPVVATMTAAEVGDWTQARVGSAWVIATVGLSVPLAAAGSLHEAWEGPGTINMAVLLVTPLSDTGLVNAVQTLTEAKAQALAEAGVRAVNAPGPATGTATDSIMIACPAAVAGSPEPSHFAGTATPIGNDLARATHDAIISGVSRWRHRDR